MFSDICNIPTNFFRLRKCFWPVLFRTVRQELAILISMNHVNVISFVGVCITPFSMVLELAPMGALDDRYKDYYRVGKKLNPYVIQKSLQQVFSFVYVFFS